jgi:enolase
MPSPGYRWPRRGQWPPPTANRSTRGLAPARVESRLPVPCFNVINGGRHAANRLQPQEFMICAGQIKSGGPASVERVAKYNRLTAIETQAPHLPYGLAP